MRHNGTYYIHPRYPELINSEGRLFPHTVTSSQVTYDNTETSLIIHLSGCQLSKIGGLKS